MRYLLTAVLLIAVVPAAVRAEFMMPTEAPVDRLVANAQAYVKENPKDASGYYVLGRVHYLAWAVKTGRVPVWRVPDEGEAVKPEVLSDQWLDGTLHRSRHAEAERRTLNEYEVNDVSDVPEDKRKAFYRRRHEIQQELTKAGWKPEELDAEALDPHATQAFTALHQAIKLDADNGLYHLGLASLVEQYAPRAGERGLWFEGAPAIWRAANDGSAAEAEPVTDQWYAGALSAYRRAFELSHKQDAKLEYQPLMGIASLVSYEAAKGYQRVADMLGKDIGDAKLIARMNKHLKTLQALPMGPITPIVFSFAEHDSLSDLIDTDASVAFDLDGTGRAQRWAWVKPTTALLVWDPAGRGRITSGRQLFGSVTWWILPGDGYRAMDLLDDDRDGELAGAELRGLAAWFDHDGDGLSDPGEVTVLSDLGVAGLAVEATSRDGEALMHPAGLRMKDGRTLPTYDWIAQPAQR